MISACVYGFPVIVMKQPNVTGATPVPSWTGLDGYSAPCLFFSHSNKDFPKYGKVLHWKEEEQMDSKDTNNVVEFPAPGQDLYLPFGATDPDFYIPADCDRNAGGFSRWLRALPVFGRQRP